MQTRMKRLHQVNCRLLGKDPFLTRRLQATSAPPRRQDPAKRIAPLATYLQTGLLRQHATPQYISPTLDGTKLSLDRNKACSSAHSNPTGTRADIIFKV